MNIINTIQDQLSPELLGQVSTSVGESPEATKSALNHALPALLGSAAAEASSPEGATNLFNLLKDKAPQGGWPATASGLLGTMTGGAGAGIGSSLISSLLGPKANMIRDFIANRSGVGSGSASTLLGTAAQLLMGFLGRHVATQGLGPSGFGELLRSQIPHLQGVLPPELGNMLGISNLLGVGTTTTQTASSAAQAVNEPATAMAHEATSSGPRILRWALVPLALLLGVIFLANRTHRNEGGTSDETQIISGPRTTVPGIDTASFPDRLRTAIASSDGNPIDLQGMSFDSSGNLSPAARNSLSVMGTMVHDNPSLRMTITTYGGTADEAAARANAIKAELAKTGIADERIISKPEIGEGIPKVSFTK